MMPASQLSDGLSYISYSACCCRYLTFYSYTLQLLQLVAASFSHIVRVIVARELPSSAIHSAALSTTLRRCMAYRGKGGMHGWRRLLMTSRAQYLVSPMWCATACAPFFRQWLLCKTTG